MSDPNKIVALVLIVGAVVGLAGFIGYDQYKGENETPVQNFDEIKGGRRSKKQKLSKTTKRRK